LYELHKVAGDQTRSLYDISKAVYGLLRYGVRVRPDRGENTETVGLIDWKDQLNNDFACAEEVTVEGEHTKRPDVVLCEKRRFLEMIHDFVVFDAGVKKICRHNQYFGVRKALEGVRKREGGIIWHTQGSGKSLTMVWLAKWIRENVQDARVLIITDRTELDEQIEKVFKGVDENIYRTKSGQDLINKLNATTP
jgi:type I site-specific restriction-modification system R (restriction) subunit